MFRGRLPLRVLMIGLRVIELASKLSHGLTWKSSAQVCGNQLCVRLDHMSESEVNPV